VSWSRPGRVIWQRRPAKAGLTGPGMCRGGDHGVHPSGFRGSQAASAALHILQAKRPEYRKAPPTTQRDDQRACRHMPPASGRCPSDLAHAETASRSLLTFCLQARRRLAWVSPRRPFAASSSQHPGLQRQPIMRPSQFRKNIGQRGPSTTDASMIRSGYVPCCSSS